MSINSITANQNAAAHAATAAQAAKKPSKPFPSMSELMAAGQPPVQQTNTTTTVTGTSSDGTNKA